MINQTNRVDKYTHMRQYIAITKSTEIHCLTV